MKPAYKVTDIVRLSLHSLTRHLGRSILTALGIIFGVFSVIAMLAIMAGAGQESQKLLRELGSDNIILNASKVSGGQSKASQEQARVLVYGLKEADVERLKTIPDQKKLVIARMSQMSAYANGKFIKVDVIATEPAYCQVARVDMVSGRFFSDPDISSEGQYCVMTTDLAREFFGPNAGLKGNQINLAGDTFTVIGVMDRLPGALQGRVENPRNCLIIPLTTQKSHFSLYTVIITPGSIKREMAEVNQVILQMADEDAVLAGAEVARRLLEKYHPDGGYEVKVPLELIEQQKAQARLWNITFGFIAAVSLIVGGIGVMNIMLASVTERTREIGIRRALGAKRRDIIAQFLTEAVTLSVAGGVLGIALGFIVPWCVEQILRLKTVISTTTMMVPFVTAVVVGLLSGLYPAWRAARLDPIEALRHE